jgi:hypothetical protein
VTSSAIILKRRILGENVLLGRFFGQTLPTVVEADPSSPRFGQAFAPVLGPWSGEKSRSHAGTRRDSKGLEGTVNGREALAAPRSSRLASEWADR